MKCSYCSDSKILFTIIPEISNDIAWASHVVSDVNGQNSMYHYECGKVAVMDMYVMLHELSMETKDK